MDSVIDTELAAFLDRPVMLMAATRSAEGRAAIARGMGVRLSPDRSSADLLVSRTQWPDALRGLEAGAPIALTACDPVDYRTFQIKGRLLAMTNADADDLTLGENYRERTFTNLKKLGVEDRQIRCWLAAQDLVRLRFIPLSVFHQTPGKDAGMARTSLPQGQNS